MGVTGTRLADNLLVRFLVKKLLYNLAIGPKYAQIESLTGPYRRAWAERWGWEYRPVTEVPDWLLQKQGEHGLKFALDLFKLYNAAQLKDYDLVVYSDTDTVWNPNAPDLATYYDKIPVGGFGGVQVVSPEARGLFPEWVSDYYSGLELLTGHPIDVPNRDIHFNGGLVLHKPREVAERWMELAQMDSPLYDEHRLCVHEVQAGKCLFLPSEWNVVWRYHVRQSLPELDWRKCRVHKYLDAWNYLSERVLMSQIEAKYALETWRNVNMLHFANEAWKVRFFSNPAKCQQTSRRLPSRPTFSLYVGPHQRPARASIGSQVIAR